MPFGFAKVRVMGVALALSVLLAVLAGGSYWRLRVDCECPPSRFEKTSFLYKITHLQPTTTRYYSQYYEDYVLGYVFKGQRTGFYIDVGANDPNLRTTTRYFYERGWTGMNVEPNTRLFKKIVQFRPRDMNYNVGISNTEGTLTFYEAAGPADPLSTFDKTDAERVKKEQGVVFAELAVPVTTLNALLARKRTPPISFISIDVEGFEKQVIGSIDLARYKPTVLCIEAADATSGPPSYTAWEGTLLKADYIFAMTDGLNRYYLHRNRLDLLSRFIFADMCVRQSKLHRQVKMNGYTSWNQ